MLSEALAWRAILQLRQFLENSEMADRFFIDRTAKISTNSGSELSPILLEVQRNDLVWHAPQGYDDESKQLLDLYLPVVMASIHQRPYVVAHLAQSLDGYIATKNGSSQWISGHSDRIHNHRMRALCDAVLVGAETVLCDDPLLTCRTVEGRQPIRVVLDPKLRLPRDRRLFTDTTAPTIIVTKTQQSMPLPTHVSILTINEANESFSANSILNLLWHQGIRRIFIEGGGMTISSFLHSQKLDRLQLTVAPVILGSGRKAIKLPPIDSLDAALRPKTRRFLFEEDTMIECVFDD